MKSCASMMLTLALGLFLGACSTPNAESLAQNDPWEKTNRDIFDFDVRVDHTVARPIARGYRSVVPEPVRDGIHNALNNLNSPAVPAKLLVYTDGLRGSDQAENLSHATKIACNEKREGGLLCASEH